MSNRINIKFTHERNCYVFGNDLFRTGDTTFPDQGKVVSVLRKTTELTPTLVMELIERMETNTWYPIDVVAKYSLLGDLHDIGFNVEFG